MKNVLCEIDKVDVSYYSYESFFKSIFLKPKLIEKKILADINFKLKTKQILGVIGDNGCGKSSLLKALSGILSVQKGSIKSNFSAYTILENSCNLNEDRSGCKNIYQKLNFLGFRKNEIDKYYDEIVSFSELGNRIYDKVKNYSSGMKSRLIFSIMIIPCPNFFIIDEILSAGDEYFIAKCIKRMDSLCKGNATAVIVSHDIFIIQRFCNIVMWLENKKVKKVGTPSEVTFDYLGRYSNIYSKSVKKKKLEILDLKIRNKNNNTKLVFRMNVKTVIKKFYFQVAIHDSENGFLALLINSKDYKNFPKKIDRKGDYEINVILNNQLKLKKGLVSLVLFSGGYKVPEGKIEDVWGWDNNKIISYNINKNKSNYLECKLKWQNY